MTGVSSLQRLLMVWSREVYPGRTDTIPRFTDWGWCEPQILISTCWLPVDTGGKAAICFSINWRGEKLAILLSLSISMVKRIDGYWLFRCCRRRQLYPDPGWWSYLIIHIALPDHRLARCGPYCLFFKYHQVEIAITADTGLSMAAPCLCSLSGSVLP